MPAGRRTASGRALAVVAGLIAVLYPLLVYLGLTRLEPRTLALLLAALLLCRLLWVKLPLQTGTERRVVWHSPPVLFAGVLMFVMFLSTLLTNNANPLKLYPVIISFSLLLGFAHSLRHPPSVIERLARLTNPQLPESGVRYTRRLTLLWCGFFFGNGCIALYTSLFASLSVWTLYNGVLSYLLIGCLLGGEYLYRHFVVKA